MRADKQPLGLTSVYVDLNLDLRIPQKLAFPDYLKELQSAREQTREAMQPERGETRLLPVLEALAHHPKMVLLGRPGSGKSTLSTYLALSLAEAALGDAAALKRLGKWWKHGPLLPVSVILREFAATLPADLDRGRAKQLWDFIAADLANSGRGEATAAALRQAAETHGALFLLDGLDEAGDEARRARVLEAVDEFTRTAGAKSAVSCSLLARMPGRKPPLLPAIRRPNRQRRGSTPCRRPTVSPTSSRDKSRSSLSTGITRSLRWAGSGRARRRRKP